MKESVFCLVIVYLSWIGSSSASLSCECGRRNRGRIVGGNGTASNEYPWMVWVCGDCGGSIITEYHILTAAHCTKGKSVKSIDVIVGKHYKIGSNKNAKKHSVSKIIQHEYYKKDDGWNINDISVLLLHDRITFTKFVSPVCLPSYHYNLVGKFVKVTGWGTTLTFGVHNTLREVDLEVISNEKCKKWWKLDNRQTQICAYSSKKYPCDGDSGGPLVYLDPDNNRYVQVALVSFGHPDCGTGSSTSPSVNTDVFAYMGWITDAVKKSQPSARYCTIF